MLVNMDTISAIFTNFKATFQKAFDAAPSQWEQTAMKVPSTGLQNDYSWIDLFPKMRKWIGDKVIKNLKAHGFTITNDEWEATVAVQRKHIETDQLGIYEPAVRDVGFSSKQLPDEIVSNLKNDAFTELCYDGQYFYDTDHPVGESTAGNKSTAALSAASQSAATASYGAARQAIMELTDDEGRPLGLVPDVLEVPPALEATAKILLNSDSLGSSGGEPNPYKGTATLVVNPRLTSSTAWFLHVTTRPIKPFIYQERKAPMPVQQTGMDAEGVFKRGEYLFGAEASCAGGYGLWQLSHGSTGLT